MKAQPIIRVTLMTTSVLAFAAADVSAVDLGKANPANWFKKKETTVPSTTEKQAQEAAAEALLRDAKTAASTSSYGKAQSIYKDIVARYRFTDAAATAQFEYALLVRAEDKLKAAYEAFQKYITDYRQSTRFNEAIEQQFQIAEEARAGKKQPTLLLIPMKLDTSELVEMYRGVIKNSPYGKYAPFSQFAIGEVYQDAGDKVNANLAFQTVVENYPNTKLASEAQFRVGAISSAAAQKTQDRQNLTTTRDALETYKAANPTGDRMTEAESLLNQVNDAQSLKSLEIAKFYESTGKPSAAAIYYNDAMKYGSPEAALQARERLALLAASYPDELKNTPNASDSDYVVPANTSVKNRDDYAGPPAPVIASMNRRSEMRMQDDNFKPIPLVEPDLPTRPSSGQPQPGMLLPPAPGSQQAVPGSEDPLLLPVPPPAPGMQAPNADALPPIPPAPAVPPVPEVKTPEATPPAPPAPAPAAETPPVQEDIKPATPPAAPEEKTTPAPSATN